MVIALINRADRHHTVATKLFSKIKKGSLGIVHVAVSALLEYDLVHRSKGYSESQIRKEVEKLLEIRNLREAPLTSRVLTKASTIRERYGLSYFDSLHAATALEEVDGVIISVDPAYDLVDDLTRMDPYKI